MIGFALIQHGIVKYIRHWHEILCVDYCICRSVRSELDD